MKTKPVHITKRERQVLRGEVLGQTPEQIAEALGMTVGTVYSHRQNVYHRTGVGSTASERIRLALQHGVVSLDEFLGQDSGGPASNAAAKCTGISARWCPNHGDCKCRKPFDLNDSRCPLHSRESMHAEPKYGYRGDNARG